MKGSNGTAISRNRVERGFESAASVGLGGDMATIEFIGRILSGTFADWGAGKALGFRHSFIEYTDDQGDVLAISG